MKKIKLGQSEVEISPLVFGAWAIGGTGWGGTEDDKALHSMICGYEKGITSIDTAPIYGFGHSEKLVGKIIKQVGRDRLEILTKFGIRWDTQEGEFYFDVVPPVGNIYKVYFYSGRNGIIKEVEDSLKRLGTDYIDLYQIHRPDVTTPIDETMEALLALKKEGKIRAAAVSNYSVEQMEEAQKIIPIVSNQVPYSMVKRSIEKEIVPYCINHNISILAYSPLQRGLLTGKITVDYPFKGDDHRPSTRFFQEPNLSRTNAFLDKIKPIANKYHATLGQVVINWTLQRPGISAVLVGARNESQTRENAASMDFKLSKEDIKDIDNHLKNLVIEG